MSIQIAKRLLTVSEYHKMAEVGILTKDDRVELINGEILTMSPIKSFHAGRVKRINALLSKLLKDIDVVLSIQDPITIDENSEPEPDIALLHYRKDFYTDSHPIPADVYLIIEVANTTLGYDKGTKKEIYAAAEIPEYWVVNLEDEKIEVYKKPKDGNYLIEGAYGLNEEVVIGAFNLKIKVVDLLG